VGGDRRQATFRKHLGRRQAVTIQTPDLANGAGQLQNNSTPQRGRAYLKLTQEGSGARGILAQEHAPRGGGIGLCRGPAAKPAKTGSCQLLEASKRGVQV
jgi:hypothetical protein